MSLLHIKKTAEIHLTNNWTDTDIVYANAPYSSNPDDYIECFAVPVSDDRELVSSGKPFNTVAFFQINIKRKIGLGNGTLYSSNETLKQLFREQIIDNVVFYKTDNLPVLEDGDYSVLPLRVYCEYRN